MTAAPTRVRHGDMPRVVWVVGEVEVSAPADWTEADVRRSLRAAPVVTRAPLPRSIAYRKKDLHRLGKQLWAVTAYSAWRWEVAPHPAFRWRPDAVRDPERVEMFLHGRKLARRTFPHRLTRAAEGERVDPGGRRFVRPDGTPVWIHLDYSPWYPLTLEQEDDVGRGIIRVSMEGEAVAYCMPWIPRELNPLRPGPHI